MFSTSINELTKIVENKDNDEYKMAAEIHEIKAIEDIQDVSRNKTETTDKVLGKAKSVKKNFEENYVKIKVIEERKKIESEKELDTLII